MSRNSVSNQSGQNYKKRGRPSKVPDLGSIMQEYIILITSPDGNEVKKANMNDDNIAASITDLTGIEVSSRTIRRYRSDNGIEPCGQGWGGRRRGVDPDWLKDVIQEYIDVTQLVGKTRKKACMSDAEIAETITVSTGIKVTASAVLRYRLNTGIESHQGLGGAREGAGRPTSEDGPRKPIRRAKVTISDYNLVQVARNAYHHTPPQGYYEVAAVTDANGKRQYIDRWVWTRMERFTPRYRQAGLRTYSVRPTTPPGYSQAQAWDAVKGGGK